MERVREYEAAQALSRRIEVDPNGLLHIFWDKNGKEVENVFDDIAPAIRQEKHVLEEYLGFAEGISGELLVVPGESQVMDRLVRETMDIARELLQPGLLTPTRQHQIQDRLSEIIFAIGAVRNAFKQRFKGQLEQVRARPIEDMKASDEAAAAGDLYRGAEAGLLRLEDIAGKVGGVGIRLRILTCEEERVKGIIQAVYIRLHRLLVTLQEDGNLTQRSLEQIADEVCGGRNNLVNGLETIWIPPYGQRVRSREVRRLQRVGRYAASGNQEGVRRALLGAYKKLRPVVKKMQKPEV